MTVCGKNLSFGRLVAHKISVIPVWSDWLMDMLTADIYSVSAMAMQMTKFQKKFYCNMVHWWITDDFYMYC